MEIEKSIDVFRMQLLHSDFFIFETFSRSKQVNYVNGMYSNSNIQHNMCNLVAENIFAI